MILSLLFVCRTCLIYVNPVFNMLSRQTLSSKRNNWSVGVEFYALAISTVISGRVPICSVAHSWWLYSVAKLARTRTWYHTQSHYHDAKPTSHCPIFIRHVKHMATMRKIIHFKAFVWPHQSLNPGVQIPDLPKCSTHLVIASCQKAKIKSIGQKRIKMHLPVFVSETAPIFFSLYR